MEERTIRQILKRYLLGTAAEKDINIVDNWYRSFDKVDPVTLSKETREAVQQEIWEKVVPVLESERKGPIVLESENRESIISGPERKVSIVPGTERKELIVPGIEKKVWILPRLIKVAAMIVLIAGAAYGLFLLKQNMVGHSGRMAYTTISTGTGEKKIMTIRDGSRLTLDAGTTIRIGDDFSKERNIELVDGEVFFDVQKDEQRPFIIQSQGLTTTVLGTSFNISAYKGLNNVSIGVVSGKVRVAGHDAAWSILERDQELVYNKNTRSYKTIALDESLTAWQEGRLLLNDLPFSEVAVILKKNFGVELVTNDDSIKNTRYTTELLATMSPAEAVEVLAAIHYLKTRQEGGKIFLYK